jgi:hypothetical protein
MSPEEKILYLAFIQMTGDETKTDKLGGTGGMHGTTEKYINFLVENHVRKGLLGRPKRRWEEIIYVFNPYPANVENMVSS